jgi:two-component system, cell cycle sensor histidine kinase and response regulator CckA
MTMTSEQHVRILLLEDNAADAELLTLALENAGIACDLTRVETEAAFREALTGPFDLIVSDYSLPSFNGSKALEMARKRRPDLPFIFVSGTIGEDAAINSLLGGATDYVLKHKPGRLVPAIRRALHETEERKRRVEAELQLQVTLAQLRSLFENLDEVFFSIDSSSGELLQISPACEQVFGLPREVFFENPGFWKQVTNTDDHVVVQMAEQELRCGRQASFERRLQRPNGEIRWVHCKLKPTADSAGRVSRIDGIISDITEKRELEGRVLRTQRLESLGSLASGIVHDLNNVLSPILMGVELLRDGQTGAKAHATLGTIEQCAQRGADLLKQILMFARGVEGRRTNLPLQLVIHELEKMVNETFPRSLRIVSDVAPDLWPVFGDRTQIEQILMNLCVNARDAMPHGGTLTVAARNVLGEAGPSNPGDPAARSVVIEVRDTGGGIPAEHLERIFDPFFTTKAPGRGTGLGLSTVSSLARNHGGYVLVDSALGKGTTFSVHLPAALANIPRSPDEIKDELPLGHGETILVVDDEAAIRDLLREMLENCGYRVLLAKNGIEGTLIYSRHWRSIDVVLCDRNMPQMGGEEMIQELQRVNPSVRAVLVSGIVEGEAAIPEMRGVRATLGKPITPTQLLKCLREVLQPF